MNYTREQLISDLEDLFAYSPSDWEYDFGAGEFQSMTAQDIWDAMHDYQRQAINEYNEV